MENFLKPFLEKRGAYSLGKVPVNTNGISDNNIKLLQKVIFKHDVLVEFKEVLNSVYSLEPFTVESDTVKETIKRLTEFLSSDEDVTVKTEVFCCVFQTFAAGCKGDVSLPLMQFFVVLCHILGFNAVPNVNLKKDTEENSYLINADNFQNAFNVDAPSLSSDSFQIFKELLHCLTKTSVNLNSSDVQAYSKWLQQLLKNLAYSQPFQTVFMEIFLISADLDLKLLEGNLEYIFCNILTQRLPIDKNFSDSYENFLNKTLNISAKFQRTVKFTTKFLSSIKSTPTECIKELILPSSVTNEFAKTVSTTSNQQCLSLLEILVQSVDECFTDISQNNSSRRTKLLLSITGELLIYFLKEVKLFAPSIASTTLQRFIHKLSLLQESIQKFGNFLFSNKTFISKYEEIVKIFLELSFYCGEIQAMINCYKDSVLQPSDVIQPKTDYNWQCCLSLDQWDKLVNLLLKSKLKLCGTVCFQLALQKLRDCKLEKVTADADDSTLKIIIYKLTSSHDEFNILQQVPPEDFALLMELLTIKQCKSVTKNVLKQMLENKSESEIWLSNLILQENSVFIVSLFSELLRETGTLLVDVVTEKSQSRFSWLLEEYFDEGNSVRLETVEGLPEKVNHLLKNFKKIRRSLNKNSEHKASLARIVEIFKLLPLPRMKDDFRRLGLSFAVGVGTVLTEDENSIRLVFESICNFLVSDMDASTSFDIGLCIKWLSELSYENETDDLKGKVIENLVRNSPNMKNGLNQVGEMIDCSDGSKHVDPLKALQTRVVLYNELGKCWQRAKKRKSDNDLIGSFRSKLAKMISEEAKELDEENINLQNCKILLKILAIEINKAIKAKDEEEMENLMKGKFPSYFDFAVKSLKNGFDEPSAVFLTVTLQTLPQLRKFLPEDAILKIWKSVRVYEKMNWRLFCTHSTDKEFEELLTDLLKMSKKFLNSESIKHSSNCFEIWVSFFEFSAESKRNSCQVRLQEIFNYIHECHLLLRDLPIKKKIFLIKFFSFCLTNKEVVITSHVLDTIILVVLECLDDSPSVEEFHELFTVEVEVASAILLRQFAWSKSKVHLTFVIFKRLLSSLMNKCNAGQEVNKEDVIMLSGCAFCLEKWASVMAKKEKDFARTSAYFITALISSIASVTVVPAVKFHLNNCINHFLSISDSHTVAYLMRILKPGYQQVFNATYNQFKKYHKYSGKI